MTVDKTIILFLFILFFQIFLHSDNKPKTPEQIKALFDLLDHPDLVDWKKREIFMELIELSEQKQIRTKLLDSLSKLDLRLKETIVKRIYSNHVNFIKDAIKQKYLSTEITPALLSIFYGYRHKYPQKAIHLIDILALLGPIEKSLIDELLERFDYFLEINRAQEVLRLARKIS